MSDILPETSPVEARRQVRTSFLPDVVYEGWKCAINYNNIEYVTSILQGKHSDSVLDIKWRSNIENFEGGYAIHHCSVCNNIEVAQLLVRHRPADVNKRATFSRTPLHWVSQCHMGNRKTVKFLLKKGADINAQDEDGSTALYFATCANNVKLVELLLLHNADITLKRRGNESALDFAVKEKNEAIINLFFESCKSAVIFTSLILEGHEQRFEKERTQFIREKEQNVANCHTRCETLKDNYEQELQQQKYVNEKQKVENKNLKRELFGHRDTRRRDVHETLLPTNISALRTEPNLRISENIPQPSRKDKNRNASTQCENPAVGVSDELIEIVNNLVAETTQNQLSQIEVITNQNNLSLSFEVQRVKDYVETINTRLSIFEQKSSEIQTLNVNDHAANMHHGQLERPITSLESASGFGANSGAQAAGIDSFAWTNPEENQNSQSLNADSGPDTLLDEHKPSVRHVESDSSIASGSSNGSTSRSGSPESNGSQLQDNSPPTMDCTWFTPILETLLDSCFEHVQKNP